jgi:hypothetical protein
MRKIVLFALAAGTGLMFAGCAEDEYGYYDDRPGYYASDYDNDVDFYYVSSRPYSRSYGPLYLRDGHYYYSRGGSYVVYDRPTRVYRNTSTRIVNRDVNVRNVRYNNERVIRDNRTRRDYDRSDTNRSTYNRGGFDRSDRGARSNYQQTPQRRSEATQVRVSNPGRNTQVNVVEKKNKKKHDRD